MGYRPPPTQQLALYIRAGMRPQWPHFNLRLDGPLRTDPPPADVEIVEAGAGDPELARWDARIGGRPRPADHAYWVREQRGVPPWFRLQTMGSPPVSARPWSKLSHPRGVRALA
jgi:hypothetical protein